MPHVSPKPLYPNKHPSSTGAVNPSPSATKNSGQLSSKPKTWKPNSKHSSPRITSPPPHHLTKTKSSRSSNPSQDATGTPKKFPKRISAKTKSPPPKSNPPNPPPTPTSSPPSTLTSYIVVSPKPSPETIS